MLRVLSLLSVGEQHDHVLPAGLVRVGFIQRVEALAHRAAQIADAAAVLVGFALLPIHDHTPPQVLPGVEQGPSQGSPTVGHDLRIGEVLAGGLGLPHAPARTAAGLVVPAGQSGVLEILGKIEPPGHIPGEVAVVVRGEGLQQHLRQAGVEPVAFSLGRVVLLVVLVTRHPDLPLEIAALAVGGPLFQHLGKTHERAEGRFRLFGLQQVLEDLLADPEL